ncbi:MAG: hypothetical protein MZV65_34025 [Chromatiales bacterium]|nr:hypothetical protein [Chromatiales bacterium]
MSEDGRMRLAHAQAVLARALATRGRGRLRPIVEGAWLALGGPACVDAPTDLEDARVYLDLLDDLEEGGDITDSAHLAEQVSELYALPDVTASDALQLMTIHKAKGLEFDTVILPGLGDRPRHDDPPLLRWMETPHAGDAHGCASVAGGTTPGMEEVEQRREQLPRTPGATGAGHPADLLLAPIRETGGEHDLLYDYLGTAGEGQEPLRGRAAAVRRGHARPQGFASAWHGEQRFKRGDQEPAGRRRCWRCSGRWCRMNSPPSAPAARRRKRRAAPGPEGGNLRRLVAGWQAPLPPAVAPWEAGAALPVPDAMPEVEFDWASETIRHVGTVVHQHPAADRARGVGALAGDPY